MRMSSSPTVCATSVLIASSSFCRTKSLEGRIHRPYRYVVAVAEPEDVLRVDDEVRRQRRRSASRAAVGRRTRRRWNLSSSPWAWGCCALQRRDVVVVASAVVIVVVVVIVEVPPPPCKPTASFIGLGHLGGLAVDVRGLGVLGEGLCVAVQAHVPGGREPGHHPGNGDGAGVAAAAAAAPAPGFCSWRTRCRCSGPRRTRRCREGLVLPRHELFGVHMEGRQECSQSSCSMSMSKVCRCKISVKPSVYRPRRWLRLPVQFQLLVLVDHLDVVAVQQREDVDWLPLNCTSASRMLFICSLTIIPSKARPCGGARPSGLL